MDSNEIVAVEKKQKMQMQKIIAAIMTILMIGIALQALVVVVYSGEYVIGFVSNTGTVDFGLTEIVYSSPSEKLQAIFLCVLSLAASVLALAAYVLLWRFFSQIAKENKPFLPGQGKQLVNVGILLIISAILSACYMTGALALSAEPMHAVVLVGTFLVTLGSGIIHPLIIFCLGVIFNYGMKLQTESDETL